MINMDIIKILKEYYPDTTVEYNGSAILKTLKIVNKKSGTAIYYILDDNELIVVNDGMGKKYNKNNTNYQKFKSIFREIQLNQLDI